MAKTASMSLETSDTWRSVSSTVRATICLQEYTVHFKVHVAKFIFFTDEERFDI